MKYETFNIQMYLTKHEESLTRVRKACLHKWLMRKRIINRGKIHWCYYFFHYRLVKIHTKYKSGLEEKETVCSKMSIIKIPPPVIECDWKNHGGLFYLPWSEWKLSYHLCVSKVPGHLCSGRPGPFLITGHQTRQLTAVVSQWSAVTDQW